jgi:hypothetical protein
MENFAVNSILSQYSLYKMTSPIAQKREKSGHFCETSPKSPFSESPDFIACVNSIDPDQPAHLYYLIWIYTDHILVINNQINLKANNIDPYQMA